MTERLVSRAEYEALMETHCQFILRDVLRRMQLAGQLELELTPVDPTHTINIDRLALDAAQREFRRAIVNETIEAIKSRLFPDEPPVRG